MNTAWDLSDLYSSMTDPQIEEDWARIDELIGKLSEYRGKIADLDSNALLVLIQEWESLQFLFHRLGLFAGLLDATNVGVSDVTRFMKQIEERSVEKGTAIIFIETELAQLSEEQWQAHLKAPELAPYRKLLELLYLQSKHTLSEEAEMILSQKGQTSGQVLTHLFSVTTDTLAFQWDSTTVTLEEVLSKFHSPEAADRKKAAKVLAEGLMTNTKTTPPILNALVLDKAINDKLRHYEYPQQARFMSDDVDRETVNAMIKAVDQAHGLVDRYYKLKKQLLNAPELFWWDRYAPLPDVKAKIDRDQAVSMVTEAFTEFSPEMAIVMKEIVDLEHIDWMPNKTKRGGAFCAYGDKECYPYVLLNYTDQPRDVMTLAHELGHAIHGRLGSLENVFVESHSSLALAEIASVFGETLLFEKLIQGDTLSKQDKIALLMSFIEDRFATVFRQVTMFQFESALHEKRRTEGELSQEQINELWDSTMRKPFESSITYTEEHKPTWMYVAHIFHWPFYVYSYAFAQLCVLALYKQYKEKGKEFVPDYLKLLKAGGSLSPKDNLKRIGLDITQPSFWQDGLDVLDSFITDLEAETRT